MSTIIDRYRSLSRAGKWAVMALAGLAGYFGVVEPTLDARAGWVQRADSLEATLEEWATGGGAIASDAKAVSLGRQIFGEAAFPSTEAGQSQALLQRLAAVMKAHGVRDYDIRERSLILPRGPLNDAPGVTGRVKRIVRDVSFECSQDVLADVIADLERSKEVASISRVFVRKTTGTGGARASSSKGLSVTIAVEAWAVDKEAGLASGSKSL